MQKALFLYSSLTGHGSILKKLDYVKGRLNRVFDILDCRDCESQATLMEAARSAVGVYDVLVFAGGDGTFNHVAAALAKEKNPPVLGYISAGTLGDVGRNFGIPRSIKKSLDIIEKGQTQNFDLGKVNDSYFVYMAAIGAYSDIAYEARRKEKKRIGRFAYYRMAVARAFKKIRVRAKVTINGETKEGTYPFLMVLNGKKVGGFRVNKKSAIDDGKMELFLTKNGFFNGLLHYLGRKTAMKYTFSDSIVVETDSDSVWCLDGEKGPLGNAEISIQKTHLRVYCREKVESHR